MNTIASYSNIAAGFVCALSALTAQRAEADSVTLPVVFEGQAQDLVIYYSRPTKVGEEQYAYGGATSSYTLTIDHIIFGPGPVYFDEAPGPFNARVLSVLEPNRSYVGLTWDFGWNCHGGCIGEGKFSIEQYSATPDLFFNSDQLPADFLKTGYAGNGAVLLNFFRSRSLEIVLPTSTSLSNFTIAVPEADSLPLALAGLGMVAWVLVARKRKEQLLSI